jgi:Asp-tRNA(Asn)/Glu-tRNA(Gln) amidotransferase A subunit family amidase
MRGDELDPFLEAAARLYRVPHPERRAQWRARLEMNAPELARFADLGDPEAEPFTHADPGTPTITRLPAPRRERPSVADALTRARAADALNIFISLDEKPGEGGADGPLAGVPIAVKDLMAVSGLPLTGGSRTLPGEISGQDAPVVARLRAAGAIVLGTANLHELAYGITSTNPHFGAIGNPHAPARIAGGSSGGSAAAVAAGIVPLSVGTDTAGSIRIPAACCGVVGFKPSYGLVPRDGVLALAWSLDHVGPIATNVADAALMLAVMAGVPVQERAPARDRRIRLVRPANFFFDLLEPSLREVLDMALQRLSAAGIEIESRPVPGVENAASVQFLTICPEAFQAHAQRLRQAPDGLGEDVRVRLEIGRFLLAADYVRAQRFRTVLRDSMLSALADADALVTPTIIAGAPEIGAVELEIDGQLMPVHTAMTRCTAPFNLTGMPAITLPCGRDKDGLPVGLQLAAPAGADNALLELAHIVERVLADATT